MSGPSEFDVILNLVAQFRRVLRPAVVILLRDTVPDTLIVDLMGGP